MEKLLKIYEKKTTHIFLIYDKKVVHMNHSSFFSKDKIEFDNFRRKSKNSKMTAESTRINSIFLVCSCFLFIATLDNRTLHFFFNLN